MLVFDDVKLSRFRCNLAPAAVFLRLMRAFLVGLILLTISGSAFGQAVGFVEKIGFGKQYRPYGWTPMLVNLTSQIGEPAEYLIQVRQEDLDRDRVVFQREIVLNPQKQEQFWVYFMAQPRGLPGSSVADLDKALDVRLTTKSGKALVKLRVQDPINDIDPRNQMSGTEPGTKLVLMVTDGSSSRAAPSFREYNGAIGLNENVTHVLVTPFDLPENVIGYDAVDAIVWLDADAGKMTTGGSRRLAAMTEYVRNGGRLVVCQTPEQFKLEAMADLLPIELKDAGGDWQIEMRDRASLEPIRTIAQIRTTDLRADDLKSRQKLDWDSIEKKGPFKVAFARLKPDAVGEQWIDWKNDGSEVSPWLARRALGLGSISWVAQDLGNAALTGTRSSGWPYVWDTVLGQRNTDMRVPLEADEKTSYGKRANELYYSNAQNDLGLLLLRGMEHEGRAGGLIFLAGVFFVGYWIIAGPVSYFILAGKKKTELSWTIFAGSALVATFLTVGVVKLVLRGDAALHHVSLVRMLPAGRTDDGKPKSRAVVDSGIGLYIPRDYSGAGNGAPVTLLNNDPSSLSYLTPYSIHPAHQGNTTDFPAYLEYEVPFRDTPLSDPVSIKVPFRSTLKKLQAHWAGELPGGIEIDPAAEGLDRNKPRVLTSEKGKHISGKLANRLGVDLVHVYLAFNSPASPFSADVDKVLYLPSWPDGRSIDLGYEYNNAALLQPPSQPKMPGRATPGGGNVRSIVAPLSILQWAEHWYAELGTGLTGNTSSDIRTRYISASPVLSFYDRLRPMVNADGSSNRVEFLRRAAREWDVSELIAAGQLVIIAQVGKNGAATEDNPIPFPMEVENSAVTGTGSSFIQYALPLDRSALPKPWEKSEEDAVPAK